MSSPQISQEHARILAEEKELAVLATAQRQIAEFKDFEGMSVFRAMQPTYVQGQPHPCQELKDMMKFSLKALEEVHMAKREAVARAFVLELKQIMLAELRMELVWEFTKDMLKSFVSDDSDAALLSL